MDKEKTLVELRDQVHEWSSDLRDAKAPTHNMRLDDWDLSFVPNSGIDKSLFGTEVVVSDYEQVEMLDQAINQLAGRMGIPVRWITNPDQCPVELRETVFNWCFENKEVKTLLMRMRGGDKLRAVLSDQYTPFDHKDLVDAVYNAVDMNGMMGDVEVIKDRVGDSLSAYLVIKDIIFDDPDRDPGMADGGGTGGLKPAVWIGNSEIGTGSTRIHGGLFRDYCTNGMIIGWKADETFRITHRFKSKTHIATLANEAIAVALRLSEEAGQRFMEYQNLILTPTNLKGIVSKWSDKYAIGVGRKETWLEALNAHQHNHGEVSYADVINEATYMANRTEAPEMVEQLERMAGDMVMADFSLR